MSFEIELKYRINDEDYGLKILRDLASKYGKKMDSEVSICNMEANYLDTDDNDLRGSGIAYRIRKENDLTVATLKWTLSNEAESFDGVGLSIRGEKNIVLSKYKEDISIFYNEVEDEELNEIIKKVTDKEVKKVITTKFKRNIFKFKFNESTIEGCVDVGDIISGEKKEPICEMEFELISGSKDDIISLSNIMKDEYSLEFEPRSKYKRGIDLGNL